VVQGYRGDGTTFGRRALPVADARLLVNLAERANPVPLRGKPRLLDPCAGIGGVVLEAREHQCRVFSGDIDPLLRHGLTHMGALHSIASADALPFPNDSLDMLATEPPYDPEIRPRMAAMLREWTRVLRPGGCLAALCVRWQAEMMRELALDLSLACYLDLPVDRKGLEVVALGWQKLTKP
jgi:tRNA G10  N-methylase Trm11